MRKRIALVTGGSRGIGLATVVALAKAGYHVAVAATRKEEFYPESIQTLKEAGAQYDWYTVDIGNSQARKDLVANVLKNHGGIDVLVNNAGVSPKVRNDILEINEENWDYVVDINAKGTMFVSQLVANAMLKQPLQNGRRGTIINISSISAEVVSPERGEYCVSKACVSMLTKLFAVRLAPNNIFVYEIRPGVIKTDMTEVVTEKYDRLIEAGTFPISRWGFPEDIALAVRSLTEGNFPYSTGNCIYVDGGMNIPQL